MAEARSFNVLYVAGMAALMLGVALAGLLLTGERHSGFVGGVELPVLIIGAGLLLAAGLGSTSSPGASWPVLAGIAGVVLVGVLAFLTWTLPEPGSAVVFELAGAVLGVVLVAMVRRG